MQRRLMKSGNAAKIRDRPERQNKVIEFEYVRLRPESGAQRDAAIREIDGFDFANEQSAARHKAMNRADGIEQTDVPRNHFRQHRLKDEVVFATDKGNLDIGVGSQQLVEIHRSVNTREATSENQNAFSLVHGHVRSLDHRLQLDHAAVSLPNHGVD